MEASVAEKPYYVYILRCTDDTLYVGITTDLRRRMLAHMGKRAGGAKYTRSHPIAAIAAAWCVPGKSAALRVEYRLKRLRRCEKCALIAHPEQLYAEEFTVCSKTMLRECFPGAMEEKP